jgi:hypothetical protein
MSVAVMVFAILMPSFARADGGYDAGYRWAEKVGADDPSYCYSRAGDYINNSPSFTEGCLAYLRDEGVTDDDDEPVSEESEEDPE